MQTPKFWKDKNIIARIFLPFSAIYYFYIRMLSALHRLPPTAHQVPIICVGNVTAGGTGKTPTAIAIAKILQEQGKKVTFVSKGYGGTISNLTIVDSKKHTANIVGDEPLLLAGIAPTIVCKSRQEGCELATRNGAEIIILDDGLHDKTINKTFSIMVIDGGFGFGNGYLLPAGAMRDSLKNAAKQADIALIIGEDTSNAKQQLGDKLPIATGKFTPQDPSPNKSIKYIAFAAIGRPQKFFDYLNYLGYDIISEIPFADHHKYNDNEIKKLIAALPDTQAKLITTQKDIVKIATQYHQYIEVLQVDIQLDNTIANKIMGVSDNA